MSIQIKRGNNANLGSLSLQAGEPAFVLDTGKLYVGNGTDKVLINPDAPENASSADKLKNARTISLTGDATGSTSFDGSEDKSITVVLKNSGATAGTYTKFTINEKGLVTGATNITAEDIPNLTLSKISDAGSAASKNVGTNSGNIPVLDASGKLDVGVIPSINITNVYPAANQAAMLALSAEVGDIAVRADNGKAYILKSAPASTVSNWLAITADIATAESLGLGNVTNESKTTMFTNAALTGTPTAPTATAGTNTTQLATTAFVKTAVDNALGAFNIDGGSF